MAVEDIIAGLIGLIVLWSIALSIVLIVRWYVKRGRPMHLWTGVTLSSEEVSDIPAFNKACCKMFTIYASVFVISGILTFFNSMTGFILTMIVCLLGIIPLGIAHHRLLRKYKRK